MKILLADDDAVTRTLLKRTLQRAGFEVVSFSDGQAALDCLLTEDGPRMAILDWVMPGKDGPAVCREVRARRNSRAFTYLILLTSKEAVDDVVRGFDAGADDYLIKPCNPEELKARIQVGMRTLQLQDSLIHEAEHDTLTGLPNRAFFVKRLAQCTRKAREVEGYQFALLFVDIDRFKNINDSLGHLAGDDLMKGVAQRLLRAVRADAAGSGEQGDETTDLVARIGGDEFVILLEDFAGADDGVRVAERVQTELHPAFTIQEHEVFITASIGISTGGGNTTDSSEVIRGADAAMYKAKLLGKDRYQVNDSSGNNDAVGLLRLENDLRRAVDHEEFEVFYQPIVDLASGNILSFEALVRWRHMGRGMLQPGSFIAAAEETGLIIPIGAWVMRQACKQAQMWNADVAREHPVSISVNVSPRQFMEEDLVKRIGEILSSTGLDPARLHLEVTENLTMQDAGRAVKILTSLSDLGISISLDDFGTGYSSLSYLLRLPIRTLKIDRSFVANIDSSAESSAIVQTIISLAHNLGMKVVAEGIESEAQRELLKTLHCDLGQGYLFSKPVEAARAAEMLWQSPLHHSLKAA